LEGGPSGSNCRDHTILGWARPYIYTLHDRKLSYCPAKNTVCAPCMWFRPALTLCTTLFTLT
jgi:hypothetical protein